MGQIRRHRSRAVQVPPALRYKERAKTRNQFYAALMGVTDRLHLRIPPMRLRYVLPAGPDLRSAPPLVDRLSANSRSSDASIMCQLLNSRIDCG